MALAVQKRGILARIDGGERPRLQVDEEGAGNGPLVSEMKPSVLRTIPIRPL
jgi:hypothetical protein